MPLRNACNIKYLTAMLVIATLQPQAASALNGSSPATAYPAVGQIVGGVDGVLVAPNWVLTAGHGATSAKQFISGHGEAMIDASFVLPGYQFPGNDLALLHLATPILASQYTALNLDYLDDSNLQQIGGVTLANASSNGQGGSWQNQYVESSLIGSLDRAGNYALHWLIADQHASGMPLLQSGDSGSGLFLSAANSQDPVLGGIASAICMTNKSCFVQPTAYRDWLDITMMRYQPGNPEEIRRQQLNWVDLTSAASFSASPIAGQVSMVDEPSQFAFMLVGILLACLGRLRVPNRLASRGDNKTLQGQNGLYADLSQI